MPTHLHTTPTLFSLVCALRARTFTSAADTTPVMISALISLSIAVFDCALATATPTEPFTVLEIAADTATATDKALTSAAEWAETSTDPVPCAVTVGVG